MESVNYNITMKIGHNCSKGTSCKRKLVCTLLITLKDNTMGLKWSIQISANEWRERDPTERQKVEDQKNIL